MAQMHVEMTTMGCEVGWSMYEWLKSFFESQSSSSGSRSNSSTSTSQRNLTFDESRRQNMCPETSSLSKHQIGSSMGTVRWENERLDSLIIMLQVEPDRQSFQASWESSNYSF